MSQWLLKSYHSLVYKKKRKFRIESCSFFFCDADLAVWRWRYGLPFFRGSLKTWGDGSLGSPGKRPAAEAGKPEFRYLAPTCKAGASSMFVILELGERLADPWAHGDTVNFRFIEKSYPVLISWKGLTEALPLYTWTQMGRCTYTQVHSICHTHIQKSEKTQHLWNKYIVEIYQDYIRNSWF